MSQTISEVLEETRRNKGLSQRRAAEELPTTTTTWRGWRRGEQIPGWEWLDPFCQWTGRTDDEIIDAIAEQVRRRKGVSRSSIALVPALAA